LYSECNQNQAKIQIKHLTQNFNLFSSFFITKKAINHVATMCNNVVKIDLESSVKIEASHPAARTIKYRIFSTALNHNPDKIAKNIRFQKLFVSTNSFFSYICNTFSHVENFNISSA
jgi:hypothetical protein